MSSFDKNELVHHHKSTRLIIVKKMYLFENMIFMLVIKYKYKVYLKIIIFIFTLVMCKLEVNYSKQ